MYWDIIKIVLHDVLHNRQLSLAAKSKLVLKHQKQKEISGSTMNILMWREGMNVAHQNMIEKKRAGGTKGSLGSS